MLWSHIYKSANPYIACLCDFALELLVPLIYAILDGIKGALLVRGLVFVFKFRTFEPPVPLIPMMGSHEITTRGERVLL